MGVYRDEYVQDLRADYKNAIQEIRRLEKELARVSSYKFESYESRGKLRTLDHKGILGVK